MAPAGSGRRSRKWRQAIEWSGAASRTCLLVDISLQDMNGLELTRLLRSQYPSLKVLVLSMYDNLRVRQ
jgi:DNA-binding NarL/FixJ family response regulator